MMSAMTEDADRKIFDALSAAGVLAVVVLDDADHAEPLADALWDGGLRAVELALRTPASIEAATRLKKHRPDMLLGLGTVLTPEQARQAKDLGGDFALAPGCSAEVLRAAADAKLPFIPGIATPSDIEVAVRHGRKLLKFFPAETSGGAKHLTSMAAPYLHLGLSYVPLGGLRHESFGDYLSLPIVPAVGGSWIAPKPMIAAGDWPGITQNASDAVDACQADHVGRYGVGMKTIVTFGEIMGRLCPPGYVRFAQGLPGPMEMTFGGAEANVAASIAILGHPTRFVSALPTHPVADACLATLRGLDVDTSHVLRTNAGRLGLYFLEKGANQRPSNVVYDRAHSAVAATGADGYNWQSALADAGWLHLSGITPALSREAFEATKEAARVASEAGLAVSCDLNFRKKLWDWEPGTDAKTLAGRCMREILPYVDHVIANEEDASDVLGIEIEGNDFASGAIDIGKYPQVARAIAGQFDNVKRIAITLRESISASHNNWGAMLYDVADDAEHFAPMSDGTYRPYEIRDIVDRVGGGDSFAAGLIFALNTPDLSAPADAIRFAVAASCLAHSTEGDINYATRPEVERLAAGNASGRVVR